MQDMLWAHTLGPLNTFIQSEAIIEVSESDFDSEISKTASDLIGMFKGPNMCTQRFSCVLPVRVTLVHG